MLPSFLAQSFPVIDFDYYLWLETRTESKNEYFYGHVYGMAGGSNNHGALSANALVSLATLLSSKRCIVRGSDVRVETPNSNAVFYPDVSVHCNQTLPGKALTTKSPTLIVEILSPSTRNYDLTTKRKEYFLIPSLRHYLLIDSETVAASLFTREEAQVWPKEPLHFSSPTDSIPLSALDIKLKLKDLYRETGLLPTREKSTL